MEDKKFDSILLICKFTNDRWFKSKQRVICFGYDLLQFYDRRRDVECCRVRLKLKETNKFLRLSYRLIIHGFLFDLKLLYNYI